MALVILPGITWTTLQLLIADGGDARSCRIAYHQGVLELRMPIPEHEIPKGLIEDLIAVIADQFNIEILKLGSTTIEREDLNCAVEADSCFYIQNEAVVRGKSIDFKIHPPPDLVVECDYINSSLNKLDIYQCLGIPEVWRYHRKKLTVYKLVEGKYQQSDRSLAFPQLAIAKIPEFIDKSYTLGSRTAIRLFKQDVRETVESKDL